MPERTTNVALTNDEIHIIAMAFSSPTGLDDEDIKKLYGEQAINDISERFDFLSLRVRRPDVWAGTPGTEHIHPEIHST